MYIPRRRRPPRPARALIEVRIACSDPHLTAAEISRVLAGRHWLVAEELTGLLTYGGAPVAVKPVVEVTGIVVRAL